MHLGGRVPDSYGFDRYEFDLSAGGEEIFPLNELPDRITFRRKGKKVHATTIFRWAKGRRALDGSTAALPTVHVGGALGTSLGAYQWFCKRLSAGEGSSTVRGADDRGPGATAARLV